ncbi:hypothetical protein vseg_003134 [Gypsophila vaccaria]
MHPNNLNHHPKPPRPPPLTVSQSLSSPTRPEPPRPDPPRPEDTALVPMEKYYSPLTSPLPATPPTAAAVVAAAVPAAATQQIVNFSRREEAAPQYGGVYGGVGGVERKVRGAAEVRRKEEVVKKVDLGIRVSEFVLCLISLSVMAADKTQGWSGDSFDRYKEYRFCLSVAVFGFVYSALEAYDVGSLLATGKYVITHRLRFQFVFVMDQILAYLLISASSAAASRVDDWQANWGKDEFTQKASASISMAFLAFVCFAMSSLISGYNLCNRDLY